MDLESTNGTFLNGEKIEGARYIELKHKDVIKFAHSTRDYVVMQSNPAK
jgi:smad nuclear-interacting protein 1